LVVDGFSIVSFMLRYHTEVREYLLVVPDLPPAGAASYAAPEAHAATGLRFGAARPLGQGWRACVAGWLGRPDIGTRPVAEVVSASAHAAASVRAPAGGQCAWLATPLHLVAGLDTVHLPRDGILALSPEERESLAADFARSLGGGGLALVPAGREAFLLLGLELGAVRTVDPVECLGSDLSSLQPTGPSAVPLRRLMSEIEMWLHEHAVNQQRIARGARPLRALWLWGGDLPAGPSSEGSAASGAGAAPVPVMGRASLVFADDAWTRAAAALAGARLAAEGDWPDGGTFAEQARVLVTARFHGEDVPDAATFESRYLGPAFAALRAGSIDRLTVVGAGRSVTVGAGDRYWFWRPRRDWLTALGH
jgi:hypothetical protein